MANEPFNSAIEHLAALVARFRLLARQRVLEREVEGDAALEPQLEAVRRDAAAAKRSVDARVAAARAAGVELPLAALVETFDLAPFEADVVALALTPYVDPGFKRLLGELYKNPVHEHLDVERVVTVLGETLADRLELRQAFTSESALIKRRIIQLRDTQYTHNPSLFEVRISPSAVNALTGRSLAEPTTRGVATLTRPTELLDRVVLPEWKDQVVELVVGFRDYADKLDAWGLEQAIPYGRGLVILFSGPPGTGKTMLAHALAQHTARPLLTIHVGRLADHGTDAEELLNEVLFEASFYEAILFFDDCESLFERNSARFYDNLHLLERFEGVILMATNGEPRLDPALERRVTYHARFRLPTQPERAAIWSCHLPAPLPLAPDVDVDQLAGRFELSGGQIKNAVLMAVNRALAGAEEGATLADHHLHEASAAQLRHRLDEFGDELQPDLSLDDLILEPDLMDEVLEVLTACQHHSTLLHEWGMARRLTTGRGVVVLLDGPPGTGKTLTCEVLAAELERPIHRIHLAQVVSKWVGETEKHIQNIFIEARSSHAILLFDEADALFGSRVSDVSSAQDRFVNMETNQLLAEIERFDGMVFLTTNLESNIDQAFKRRIHYRITYDEPEAEERIQIWRRLIPPWLPTEGAIDYETLGRTFELPGGNIKNAILRACHHALGEGHPLNWESLLFGARRESESAGRLFKPDELEHAFADDEAAS